MENINFIKNDLMDLKSILHIVEHKSFLHFIQLTFDSKLFNNTYLSSNDLDESFDITPYNVLFIHYLSDRTADILSRKNLKGKKVIWYVYGHDAFRFSKFQNSFLEPLTVFLKLKLAYSERKRFISLVLKHISPSLMSPIFDNKKTLHFVKNIDIICPVIPQDYKILKRKYNTEAEMFHVNYINPILLDKPSRIVGNSILLGNSASSFNNHLDTFKVIKKIKGYDKIYLPLSYGDKTYASRIKQKALKLFGDKVIVLDTFLPFDDYQKIIQQCEFVIMNHKRQQAVGNIVQALYSGAHVYLNKYSPFYDFLKSNRFVISEINNEMELRKLNEDEKDINIKKCHEIFGYKVQRNKIKELLNRI
jgi:hypothetical protein